MTDTGSSAPKQDALDQLRPERDAPATQPRLTLPKAVSEVLAIVSYVTGADGPLQSMEVSANAPSPWNMRLLRKAQERLEVVDGYLRGRVAFFVAAEDHGYRFFDADLDLAEASLATCRAATLVVEALLAARLPSEREFDAMNDAVLRIHPALDAI